MIALYPSESEIFAALGNVLESFGLVSSDPSFDVLVIQGQVNRVPEPPGPDFCVMWPLTRTRLAVNITNPEPTEITGTISGNILSVASVQTGCVRVGQMITGSGVTPGCYVKAFLAPANSVHGEQWQVSPTADTSGAFYLGENAIMDKTEVMMQVDVHGPASADNATRIQTLFRSQYAIDGFAAQNRAISPLYTSDPRQIPFDNGEQQVEERWIVDVAMQVNFVVRTPQMFADTLTMTAEPVEILAV